MIRLAYPWLLLLLFVLLLIGGWLWRRGGLRPRMKYSSFDLLRDVTGPFVGTGAPIKKAAAPAWS